jgi:hypothetical protein
MGNTIEWIGYIMIGKRVYYIKDLKEREVLKKFMMIDKGDTLKIKGLGNLVVRRIWIDNEFDSKSFIMYKEIALMCERVV